MAFPWLTMPQLQNPSPYHPSPVETLHPSCHILSTGALGEITTAQHNVKIAPLVPVQGMGLLVKPESALAVFNTGSHSEAQQRVDVLIMFQAHFHINVLFPSQADSMDKYL